MQIKYSIIRVHYCDCKIYQNFYLIFIGKTRSYKPNRRGGRAHGGGGNRPDDKTQGSNSNQPASARGRGQLRSGRGLQNASHNTSNNSSKSTKRPDLGKIKSIIHSK